jgi:hypothetical protein
LPESARGRDIARVTVMAITPAVLIIVLIAVAVWWAQPAHVFFGRRGPTDAVDFAVFYSAGRLVASGDGDQIYTPSALQPLEREAQPALRDVPSPLPYLNPPFFALAIAPLTMLSFDRAFQVWSLMKLALIVLECWMVWRMTAGFERRWRVLAVGGMLTLMPIAYSLALGQFSMIIMTSWTASYMLLRSGRDRAAGLALAPLLIKPELLIPAVLMLAWKRRTGVFTTLIPAGMVAAAASVAVVGLHGAISYPAFVLRTSSHATVGINDRMMMGWNCTVTEIFGDAHDWPDSYVLYTLYLVTFAALVVAWLGDASPRGAHFPRQWMMLTLATVLVDPHFYLQDTPMVIAAGIAVAVSVDEHLRPITGAALAMGWIVLALGLMPMREWNVNLFTVCMALGVVALLIDAVARNRARSTTSVPELVEMAAAA